MCRQSCVVLCSFRFRKIRTRVFIGTCGNFSRRFAFNFTASGWPGERDGSIAMASIYTYIATCNWHRQLMCLLCWCWWIQVIVCSVGGADCRTRADWRHHCTCAQWNTACRRCFSVSAHTHTNRSSHTHTHTTMWWWCQSMVTATTTNNKRFYFCSSLILSFCPVVSNAIHDFSLSAHKTIVYRHRSAHLMCDHKMIFRLVHINDDAESSTTDLPLDKPYSVSLFVSVAVAVSLSSDNFIGSECPAVHTLSISSTSVVKSWTKPKRPRPHQRPTNNALKWLKKDSPQSTHDNSCDVLACSHAIFICRNAVESKKSKKEKNGIAAYWTDAKRHRSRSTHELTFCLLHTFFGSREEIKHTQTLTFDKRRQRRWRRETTILTIEFQV